MLGIESGRFLDIGANDGVTFSNTFALAERGWQGVCVEADPHAHQALIRNMERFGDAIQCIHAAVITGGQTQVELHAAADSTLSSTMVSHVRKWEGQTQFSKMRVPAMSINGLARLIAGSVHVISIDTEGTSVILLHALKPVLHIFNPKLIVVEINSAFDADVVRRFEGKTGFARIATTANNAILEAP